MIDLHTSQALVCFCMLSLHAFNGQIPRWTLHQKVSVASKKYAFRSSQSRQYLQQNSFGTVCFSIFDLDTLWLSKFTSINLTDWYNSCNDDNLYCPHRTNHIQFSQWNEPNVQNHLSLRNVQWKITGKGPTGNITLNINNTHISLATTLFNWDGLLHNENNM